MSDTAKSTDSPKKRGTIFQTGILKGLQNFKNATGKKIDNALEKTYDTVSGGTVTAVQKTAGVVKNFGEGTVNVGKHIVEGSANAVKTGVEGTINVVKQTGEKTTKFVTDIIAHPKDLMKTPKQKKKGEIEIVTSFDIVKISSRIHTDVVSDLREVLEPFSFYYTREENFPDQYTKVLFDKHRKEKKQDDEISLAKLKKGKNIEEEKKKLDFVEDDDDDDLDEEVSQRRNALRRVRDAVVGGLQKRRDIVAANEKKDLKVVIDMRGHSDILKNYKRNVSDVLIRDVTMNYKLFLSFSKEVARVEGELIEVGKLWNEMKRSINLVTEMNKNSFRMPVGEDSFVMHDGIDSNERNKIIEDFHDTLVDFHRCLSIRDWAQCLERYEKGIQLLEMKEQVDIYRVRPEFALDFQKAKEEFSSMLFGELRNSVASFSTIQLVVNILKKMNLKDQAVSTYLEARGVQIRNEISKIYSTGNNLVYANLFSGLFFMNLKKCSDQFKTLFLEEQTSEFLKWVIKELSTFCEQFRAKVFSMCSNDFKIVSMASNLVFTHAEKLSENGISITFRLRDFFRRDIESAMIKFFDDAQKKMSQSITLETWQGVQLELPTRQKDTVPAFTTDSGKDLYMTLLNFIEILSSIASNQIYQIAVTSVTNHISLYYAELFRVSKNVSMNDKQFFSLISNASFINKGLLPMIQRELKPIFRELPELNRFAKQIGTLDRELVKSFCLTRAEVITSKLGFHQMGYPSPVINEDFKVSRGFVGYTVFLATLMKELDKYERLRYKEIILPTIMEKIIDNLAEKGVGTFTDRLNQSKVSLDRLRPNDMYSVILDLKFLLSICSDFLEKTVKIKLENFIKMLAEKYTFSFENLDKDDKFYEKIIRETLKNNQNVVDSLKILKARSKE